MIPSKTLARHGRAINIGYVDTHVEVVELEDLWKQYWHRGYEPRDDVVVPDCRISCSLVL